MFSVYDATARIYYKDLSGISLASLYLKNLNVSGA